VKEGRGARRRNEERKGVQVELTNISQDKMKGKKKSANNRVA